MPHLLLAGKLHPSGLEVAKSAKGVTFDYVEDVSEASYVPLIGEADALVVRTQPVTAATIAGAPRLKVVSRHGVGYDAVDVGALNARGIALTIVGDVNSVSVAEHAMTLLLACAKRLLRGDAAARDPAKWNWRNRLEASEIAGKNLLIVGYGRIGSRLARLAAAFDVHVRAYDPFLLDTGWPPGEVVPVASLEEGLAWADAISLHLPKSDGPLIGAAEIAAMKPGAILINTARGGIVNEAALAAGLQSGQIGAAGLDVFETEPPPAGHPLSSFDQVVLSPHNAGLSAEAGERMAIASVANAIAYLDGTIDRGLVVNAASIGLTPEPSA
jgi:D-3-phosphoglycerate dehydrogenase